MAKLDSTKRADLPDSAFAYVDSKGKRRLPINDAAHVRNALARFEQVSFEDEPARERARKKLLTAAKKHGIVPVGFITGQLQSERERGVKQAKRACAAPHRVRHDDDDRHRGVDRAWCTGSATATRELIDSIRSIFRESAVGGGGIVVETRADEFFAVFTEPGAALDAAIAIQRDLRARSWADGVTVRVRIGIHSGEPTVTDANYIGMDVHAAARICAAAHGGQIVVSSATRQAALRTTQTTVRYRSLGAHRLRGIPEPMTLFQVGAKGLAAKFPPPRKS